MLIYGYFKHILKIPVNRFYGKIKDNTDLEDLLKTGTEGIYKVRGFTVF